MYVGGHEVRQTAADRDSEDAAGRALKTLTKAKNGCAACTTSGIKARFALLAFAGMTAGTAEKKNGCAADRLAQLPESRRLDRGIYLGPGPYAELIDRLPDHLCHETAAVALQIDADPLPCLEETGHPAP